MINDQLARLSRRSGIPVSLTSIRQNLQIQQSYCWMQLTVETLMFECVTHFRGSHVHIPTSIGTG